MTHLEEAVFAAAFVHTMNDGKPVTRSRSGLAMVEAALAVKCLREAVHDKSNEWLKDEWLTALRTTVNDP
jgi:hypothetical protein